MTPLNILLVDPHTLPAELAPALRRLEVGLSLCLASSVKSVLNTQAIDLVVCPDSGSLASVRDTLSTCEVAPALVAVADWEQEEADNAIATGFVSLVLMPAEGASQLALNLVHWWMRRRAIAHAPRGEARSPNRRGLGMSRRAMDLEPVLESRTGEPEAEEFEPQTGIRLLEPTPSMAASGGRDGKVSLGRIALKKGVPSSQAQGSLPPETVRQPTCPDAPQQPEGQSEPPLGLRLVFVDADTTRADAVATALRARGAWVHPLPSDVDLVHWRLLRRFAPHLFLFDRNVSTEDRAKLLSALKGDRLLRNTPYHLADYRALFRPQSGAVSLSGIGPVLGAVGGMEAELPEALASGRPVSLSFKQVPPAKLLEVLAATEKAVAIQVIRGTDRFIWSVYAHRVGSARLETESGKERLPAPQALDWFVDASTKGPVRIEVTESERGGERYELQPLLEALWNGDLASQVPTAHLATPPRRPQGATG